MNKPKNPVFLGIKLFGLQLVLAMASIGFMGATVSFLTSNLSAKIYSSLTALAFLYAYYHSVWDTGRRDMMYIKVYNNHHDDKMSVSYTRPLIAGIVYTIPNVIALVALAVSGTHGTMNFIYRLLQNCFLGWLGDDNLTYIPNCIIVTIIPLLITIPAYIAGSKEFSIIDKYLPKLIYKNPEKKNKNK